MSERIFSCCTSRSKIYKITYTVGGENKTYEVCDLCSKMEWFAKFIVKKEHIYPRVKRSIDD